ncbi:MAG: mucoidy inhibitor MuiA family protein [Planctomycetes bacterium]|nr:mucoidy inhibitor MuiA family protein [Planctomycetota bacterium]
MRKWFFLCGGFAALVGIVVSGQAFMAQVGADQAADRPEKAPKITPSKVVKVTVYPNSALVTREVDVPKGEGLVELTIGDLPVQIVQSSLYAESSDGIRVLTTRYRTRPVQQDTREEVRKLTDEMKKQQLSLEKIESDIKTIEQNLAAIAKLENFTDKSTVTATEKGGLNSDTVVKLITYVMEQRTEKTKELIKLRQDAKALGETFAFLTRKLASISTGSSKIERDAVIVVDRTKGAAGKVKLNYLVDSVVWNPQYKLRAGKAADDVQMDYLAAMTQRTGEDWNNVELTLSTAQPMLNAAPLDLKALSVMVMPRSSQPVAKGPGSVPNPPGQPSPMLSVYENPKSPAELAQEATKFRIRAQELANANKDNRKEVAELFNEAAAFDQARELTKTPEEIAHERVGGRNAGGEGPSVAFHLKAKVSIPSRNDEQIIEIAKLTFAPKYYYKAVPVLNPHVYRLADLVNKTGHVLLPGEATMYQGTDFVGRMNMPLVAIGEEFTAGFGVDPQLQVKRKLTDKARSTQGGNQVLKYDYRIPGQHLQDRSGQDAGLGPPTPLRDKRNGQHHVGEIVAGVEQGSALRPRRQDAESSALGPRGRAGHERRKGAEHHLRVPHRTRPPDGDQQLHDEVTNSFSPAS